jgi:hypothetical protein
VVLNPHSISKSAGNDSIDFFVWIILRTLL